MRDWYYQVVACWAQEPGSDIKLEWIVYLNKFFLMNQSNQFTSPLELNFVYSMRYYFKVTYLREYCSLYPFVCRGTRDGSGRLSGSRQSSFELECHWNDPRPWSSTDSDSSTWSSKPSHSDNNPKLCKPGTRNTLSTVCPNFAWTLSTYSIIIKHI